MTRTRVHLGRAVGAADAGVKGPASDPPDVAGSGVLTRDETIRRSIAKRDQGTPGVAIGKSRVARPRRRRIA